MAEQVIIEFVGDSSKLEEAYNKVNDHINQSANLNKDAAAAFQKANSEMAINFLDSDVYSSFQCYPW